LLSSGKKKKKGYIVRKTSKQAPKEEVEERKLLSLLAHKLLKNHIK
jgi:hypothetical protein